MRWEPGFLCSGPAFAEFWETLRVDGNSPRRGLFIGGRGFDPRTTVGPSALAETDFPVEECRLIHLSNPQDSPDRPRSPEAARNEEVIRELFSGSTVQVDDVSVRDSTGRLVGSAQVRNLYHHRNWLSGFTDVIVDISGLPTSVSFPLLGMLISIFDDLGKGEQVPYNLHCIVCENADVDEHILAEGGDTADYIDPFRGQGALAADPDPITIWAPVLGERQPATLRKIHEMLEPAEVKPFLPFPARNPRRGDELIADYHSLLFETWGVDAHGFIYADERDPFDIYRQLGELADDYSQSLKPLGSARTVVSTHSSKLLSLGILLAAFEHTLAIVHVEPTRYRLDLEQVSLDNSELYSVWLAGEAYVSP